MTEATIAVLRELGRADEKIGAALAEVDRLATEVDAVRAQAEMLKTFWARLPAERERRAAALERAKGEAAEALQLLADAETAVQTAKPDAAREAELFAVRARDRASVADRRVTTAQIAAESLENETAEATVRRDDLHARAGRLAAELSGLPRVAQDAGKEPGDGLDGVEAWGEVARAGLFVARGQLAAERDAVIRQANEIGALALGEPLTAMGTGALARRVEQALG